MIQCVTCCEWFHDSCINGPRGITDGPRGSIFCCGRSGGTNFSATDVLGGPLLGGGTNFRVTALHNVHTF